MVLFKKCDFPWTLDIWFISGIVLPLSCKASHLTYQHSLDLFSRRPFSRWPTHLLPGKVGTLSTLQKGHMLYQGSCSRRVTCLTMTEGNSRAHDLVCAKAMPSRSAFRWSLVPIFYLVLLIVPMAVMPQKSASLPKTVFIWYSIVEEIQPY